jgi:MraZ protein
MNSLSSFKKHSEHSINKAGRVSIPARHREVLRTKYGNERLVLIYQRNHLAAFPIEEWAKKEQELLANPPKDPKAKKYQRLLYSLMEECVIDKPGRILISQELRDKVGLKDECIINGNLDRIEIWPKDKWEEDNNIDELFEDIDADFEINI